MSRILLISLYETNYLGTRWLASWLHLHGHETHNIFFKDMIWAHQDIPAETHLGYQYLQNGHIVRSGWDIAPYSRQELALLAKAIQTFMPDCLGLSARSPYDTLAFELAATLRASAPDALLIAGGYGPTLRPDAYLQHGFDTVIRGDGEEALLELANSLHDLPRCRRIANTSWKEHSTGEIIHNPLRAQEKNIDKYPPPQHGNAACSYINNDTLWEHYDPIGAASITFTTKATYTTLITRGCSGRCTYCSGGQWAEQYRRDGEHSYKCRLRSTEAVLMELEALDQDKFSYVDFVDECFALPIDKAKYFFQEYKKRIGLPFSMYLHYEKMLRNPDLFSTIVAAGLDYTDIGVQTGSESFASRYYRRSGKNDIYISFAHMLFQAFISTRMHFIGGNCYEEDEDFQKTLDFIKQLPFSITNPRRNTLVNVRLKMFPHAPLATIAPRTVSSPMPAREWWRRGLLMELRRIVDDDEMDMALHNATWREQPELLHAYYEARLHAGQVAHFETLLPTLTENQVIFIGAGKQYTMNKAYFQQAGIQPMALAVNEEFLPSLTKKVDNVPVVAIERLFANPPDAHVVIFSEQATGICRTLIRTYHMPPERLHACSTDKPLLSP